MGQTSKTGQFVKSAPFGLRWRISLILVWLESYWLQLHRDVFRLLIACRAFEKSQKNHWFAVGLQQLQPLANQRRTTNGRPQRSQRQFRSAFLAQFSSPNCVYEKNRAVRVVGHVFLWCTSLAPTEKSDFRHHLVSSDKSGTNQSICKPTLYIICRHALDALCGSLNSCCSLQLIQENTLMHSTTGQFFGTHYLLRLKKGLYPVERHFFARLYTRATLCSAQPKWAPTQAATTHMMRGSTERRSLWHWSFTAFPIWAQPNCARTYLIGARDGSS